MCINLHFFAITQYSHNHADDIYTCIVCLPLSPFIGVFTLPTYKLNI